MDSSLAKALWDGLASDQKKEMAAIAAGEQPENNDNPTEDADDDAPAPPSYCSAPLSPVHCTFTIGEAHAHYMDMVWEEREEQFWEA